MAWARWERWKGLLKREVGHAAGDRRTEAVGEVEAGLGREPDAASLERVERAVRRRHHDIPDPLTTPEAELERAREREPGYGPNRREWKRR